MRGRLRPPTAGSIPHDSQFRCNPPEKIVTSMFAASRRNQPAPENARAAMYRISRFVATIRRSFTTKVFAASMIFTGVVSLALILLFFLHEQNSLAGNLRKRGALFADMLTYNSRLGIFSENMEMVRLSLEAVLRNNEVLEVSIFAADGRPIFGERKLSPGKFQQVAPNEIPSAALRSRSVRFIDHEDYIDVWKPVITVNHYPREEGLFFTNRASAADENRLLGYINLVLDKKEYKKLISRLIESSFCIAFLCLTAEALFLFLIARNVTRPLNRLTDGVIAFGTGNEFHPVAVETEDEIGQLAVAFNTMVESLRKREEEKKELEEQLRHASKMEAIGTLAGGVSHDFNNILTAMIGYINILRKHFSEDDPGKVYIEKLASTTLRAESVTKRLLAFARSGERINLHPANLNDVIKSIEELIARLIGEEINVEMELFPHPLVATVDTAQMDQVILNLATNARDAMPNGGRLRITTSRTELDSDFLKAYDYGEPGPYAVITISDTGTGIDDSIRDKIFDPFFTTKEVGKGTGLGLSMTYGIIKKHMGFIRAESGPGEGSTFTVYIPLISPER